MTKSTLRKKKTTALQCAHCMAEVNKVAISGQTAAGKKQEMISFTVCEPCYTKMDNKYGSAATKSNLRTLFWEKVNKNVLKLTQK